MEYCVRAEKLLDLQSADVRVQMFTMREHDHIQDGDGAWHCLPVGSRVIVLTPYPTSKIDLDKLSFACSEAIAATAAFTLPGDPFSRVFDVRPGYTKDTADDLPF